MSARIARVALERIAIPAAHGRPDEGVAATLRYGKFDGSCCSRSLPRGEDHCPGVPSRPKTRRGAIRCVAFDEQPASSTNRSRARYRARRATGRRPRRPRVALTA